MLEGQLIRPVWAEVDLNCIAHNMKEVKRLIGKDVEAMAVIKADGYGHGALHIAETLIENGATHFAVATLSEALVLRKKFETFPILILGYTPSDCLEHVVRYDLMQTIFTMDQALTLSEMGCLQNKTAMMHIKLDTGMRRLGFAIEEETVTCIEKISKLPMTEIKGIFTHFAKADEQDKTFTHEQMKKYFHLLNALDERQINYGLRHVANSAGIIDLPEYHLDMVRAGIMLYGLYPSDEVCHDRVTLKEAMQLKARIAHVKDVQPGEGISYGQRYIANDVKRIATLPLGYADGFTRLLSFKATALVKGKACPVVGTICMDQCMLDVTGIEVQPNDEVVLFGESEGVKLTIDAYAKTLGTINYEVVCMMGKRIPRVYYKNKFKINVEDFNLTHDFL